MNERFGINMDDKSKDVYNDLFQEENISIVENKEGIMIGQEIYGLDGCTSPSGSKRKRNFVPQWHAGSKMKTPDGKNGTTDASGTYDGYEQLELLGRGLAKIRPTNYAQYELWKNCGDDMRHNSNTGSISHVSTTIFRHLKEAAVNILVNQLILLTVPILCVAISLSQL